MDDIEDLAAHPAPPERSAGASSRILNPQGLIGRAEKRERGEREDGKGVPGTGEIVLNNIPIT